MSAQNESDSPIAVRPADPVAEFRYPRGIRLLQHLLGGFVILMMALIAGVAEGQPLFLLFLPLGVAVGVQLGRYRKSKLVLSPDVLRVANIWRVMEIRIGDIDLVAFASSPNRAVVRLRSGHVVRYVFGWPHTRKRERARFRLACELWRSILEASDVQVLVDPSPGSMRHLGERHETTERTWWIQLSRGEMGFAVAYACVYLACFFAGRVQ